MGRPFADGRGRADARLVAVIAAAPVPRFEGPGHSDLGDFFAVSDDAKFGFAGQHLFAGKYAGFPADAADFKIAEYGCPGELAVSIYRLI